MDRKIMGDAATDMQHCTVPADDGAEADRAGHRRRLRDRFLGSGGDAMADYELLELILCTAIPRRDVKPIAKSLIREFGGFAEVVSASPARLQSVSGLGPAAIAAIKVIQAGALRLARQQILDKPVLTSWQRVVDYCHMILAHEKVEHFRLLFLDRRNRLIADEVQQRGTVDHTPVYPREIMARALELGAAAIILVHNHPSGDPTPSGADIEMTREVVNAGRALGILVHDHIVVGRERTESFKGMGLL